MEKFDYTEIRPYRDEEVDEAINLLIENPYYQELAPRCFPGKSVEEVSGFLKQLHTINDFQYKVMHNIIKMIAYRSSGKITVDGTENIVPDVPHLYISNHRDIVLDAAILQLVLVDCGLPPSEITVGNNLLGNDFFKTVAKLNRMIVSIRGCSLRESWTNSQRLSSYIRESIMQRQQSVWIAQRNGRAKDGNDRTEIGLLKMLNISGEGNVAESFKQLNLVPYSVSYQYESCDFLRTRELFLSRRIKYVKQPNEDFNSVVTGITQEKGNVHYSFGKIDVTADSENITEGLYIRSLAEKLDEVIIKSYKLWNTNYIAYDILNGNNANENDFYSTDDKKFFIDRMNEGLSKFPDVNFMENEAELKDIFLRIYANPIINKLSYNKIV